MNLHVTNDSYGLYPVEIAKRIRNSGTGDNNRIVNLYPTSVYKDSLISYIPEKKAAFIKYIAGLDRLDKIIFHPYNETAYRFLQEAVKKFPGVTVYWMCWSYELYNLPHLLHTLYEPFSAAYLAKRPFSINSLKKIGKGVYINTHTALGLRKDYKARLEHAHSLVHYFCSPFYADYQFLETVTPGNKIQYLPVAYLSLEEIIPNLHTFISTGNKVMIGHSASLEGNHYEVLQKVSEIDASYPVLLPLSYGDIVYGDLIKKEARERFDNVEVLENKLERNAYYQKLTEVGWAIFNSKVQQGVGNIMGLIWMGAKVFLDKDTSTYKDLSAWGIHIFSIQNDLNKYELSNRLSFEQIENNRKKILEKFNGEMISLAWKELLY